MDPVHQNENGAWYFWTETWAYEMGPYDTEELCRMALKEYCEAL
jgi:hypothetical protein